MASEVDIANLALAHLGDDATVATLDPPEGSAQAEHCARFYPVARDALLEMHAWKFATRRARLAALDTDSFNWAFAYAEPNGCLRTLAVLTGTSASTDEGQPYETESNASGAPTIYTDQEDAVLRYIARVTDTTKFSPLFVDALARLLASYLAGPLIKGDAGKAEAKAQFAHFRIALADAKISDANQRKVDPVHTPDWIANR
jgi:hypothetical protein